MGGVSAYPSPRASGGEGSDSRRRGGAGWQAVTGIALAAVAVTLSATAVAQQARPWDLSIRAFSEYNDNVSLSPEDDVAASEQNSTSLGLVVSGKYRFYREGAWTAGVGGSTFHKEQISGDVDSFSVSAFTPNLFVEHRARPFAIPTRSRAAYSFSRVFVSGKGFEKRHSLGGDVRVTAHRTLQFGPRLSVAHKDFDSEGTDPAITSRDSVRLSTGFTGTWRYRGRYPTVTLDYGYSRNLADGGNFDTASHAVMGRVTQPIVIRPLSTARNIVRLFATLQASYANIDYFNFSTAPRRTQDNYQLRGLLYLPLGRHLAADLSYTYARNDANQSGFDTRRNLVALGLTYRF